MRSGCEGGSPVEVTYDGRRWNIRHLLHKEQGLYRGLTVNCDGKAVAECTIGIAFHKDGDVVVLIALKIIGLRGKDRQEHDRCEKKGKSFEEPSHVSYGNNQIVTLLRPQARELFCLIPCPPRATCLVLCRYLYSYAV